MHITPIAGRTAGRVRRAALFTGISMAAFGISATTAAPARADGTAAGHATFVIDCSGLGTVTISVPNSSSQSNPWSAAQVVGSSEHLLPTSFAEKVVDVTTGGNTIFSFLAQQANGSSHPNQQTTTCSTSHSGTFSQLAPPGTPIPPGVSPTDTLTDTFTVTVIVQP